jgi:hypothetical protein
MRNTVPKDRKYYRAEKIISCSSHDGDTHFLMDNHVHTFPEKHSLSGKGWSPEPGRGHITFEYKDTITPSGMEIFESFHGGSITKVLGASSNTKPDWIPLYINTNPLIVTEARVFSPQFIQMIPIKVLRIEFDTKDQIIEIFSIRLFVDPSEKWNPVKVNPNGPSMSNFTDLTIVLEDNEIKCHKIVIANKWYLTDFSFLAQN